MTSLNLGGDEKIRNKNKRIEMKMKWKKWIGNQIGDEGSQAISETLKINTSLTTLSLLSDEMIRNEKKREEMKWKNK